LFSKNTIADAKLADWTTLQALAAGSMHEAVVANYKPLGRLAASWPRNYTLQIYGNFNAHPPARPHRQCSHRLQLPKYVGPKYGEHAAVR